MTNYELVGRLLHIANDLKTLYVMGGLGYRLDAKGKARAMKYAYNCQPERAAMIKAATADTWAFDCVCLVKMVINGFRGDKKGTYGGATYGYPVKDVNIRTILNNCRKVSTDMNDIAIGEFLYLHDHHCGVYVGHGQVVESTPAWRNGVQVTRLSQRPWKKHGMLPWITYENEAEDAFPYPQYTDAELAYRVINGHHGNGATRKEDLGMRYAAVQKLVNQILKEGAIK